MKNLKVLLALLAALALVFASGCPNDGSDEVYSDLEDGNGSSTEGSASSGDGSSTEGGASSGSGSIAITADDVEELLQAIGTVYGRYDNSAAWDFESGEWDGNETAGYTFTVTWDDDSAAPNASTTLENLKAAAADAKTAYLGVYSSYSLEWHTAPDDAADGIGAIKASISLLYAYAKTHNIPTSLQEITICFNPGSIGWDDSYTISNNVYYVYNEEGLAAWAMAVVEDLSISCTLYDDIEWNDTWTPIGTSDNPYTGTFDGGNYKVSNLAIESSTAYVGFFGYIGSGGEVKNLGVSIASISSNQYVVGIAGVNKGSITACYSTGDVEGDTYIGGIVGENYGTITACWSTGDVSASSTSTRAGGIAGQNSGIITACYSTGDVESRNYVGGIVGYNTRKIIACYSTGDVIGYYHAGLIAGYTQITSETDGTIIDTITACYWSGSGASGAVGSGSSATNSYKVGSTNCKTWKDAETAMNNALTELTGTSSTDWMYTGAGNNTTDAPTLTK